MHKWLPNLVAKFWLPNLVCTRLLKLTIGSNSGKSQHELSPGRDSPNYSVNRQFSLQNIFTYVLLTLWSFIISHQNLQICTLAACTIKKTSTCPPQPARTINFSRLVKLKSVRWWSPAARASPNGSNKVWRPDNIITWYCRSKWVIISSGNLVINTMLLDWYYMY